MKKKLFLSITLLLLSIVFAVSFVPQIFAVATENAGVSVDEMLNEVDLSELENYFNSLSYEQKKVFGGDLNSFIKSVLNGQASVGFNDIFTYALSIIGLKINEFLPIVALIVAVSILTGLIDAIKSNFSASGVGKVVKMATVALIAVVLLGQIASLISETKNLLLSLKNQMEIIFPLLFTFMSALGAVGSTAVYQPAVATLAFTLTQLLTSIILPMVIVSICTAIVGNLSHSTKLNKTVKFFESTAKGVMFSAFFIFATFLSVQGITASVYDNMKVRTAKFALSKYVPVIGGYLAEGFNLVLAGTVLIKNAVGLTAVLMLTLTGLPVVIEIALTVLLLKLVCALTEPFSSVSDTITSMVAPLTLLISVILGVVFCYFIFLILLVCSGNLVL